MKKSFVILISIIFCSASFSQVLNSSFEEWTELESFSHPNVFPNTFTSINDNIFFQTGELGLTEVTGLNFSAVRLETLLLEEDTLVGFGIFGNAPSAGNLIFSDGFAFSNPMPDTLAVDLRYDIDSLYPGFILVQFLNEGDPVTVGEQQDSSFIFQLQGEQTEWHNMIFDFTEFPLNGVPNECVIAFASNSALTGEGTPGNFLELDNLTFISETDSVPGGDFNMWTEAEAPVEINEWNSSFGPLSGYISRSENSFEGDYAVAISSQAIDSLVVQGNVFLAEASNFGIVTNQPLPEGAFQLDFEYDLSVLESDSARATIMLSEDDDPSTFDVISITKVLQPTSGWEHETVNFINVYPNANFYGILFESGPAYPGEGSDSTLLLIDNVEVLTLGECDYTPEVNALEIELCPDESQVLSTDLYDSYSWFLQSPSQTEFHPISDENEITESYTETGEYSVFIQVGLEGCYAVSDTVSFSVLEIPSPQISSGGIENITVCPSEEVNVQVENSDEFNSFTWLAGEEVIPFQSGDTLQVTSDSDLNGLISVQASTASCPQLVETSNYVQIEFYSITIPTISEADNTLSTESANAYQWYVDGEVIIGAISQVFNPQISGSYTVEITDINGCVSVSEPYDYEVIIIDSVFEEESVVTVFPNPVSNLLRYSSNKKWDSVVLLNLDGKEVLIEKQVTTSGALDLNHLSDGIYILRLSADDEVTTLKIIKQSYAHQ